MSNRNNCIQRSFTRISQTECWNNRLFMWFAFLAFSLDAYTSKRWRTRQNGGIVFYPYYQILEWLDFMSSYKLQKIFFFLGEGYGIAQRIIAQFGLLKLRSKMRLICTSIARGLSGICLMQEANGASLASNGEVF